MTETFTCCACGEVHPLEDRTEVDGQEFCRPCLEEETLLCRECGQRILREDNAGDDTTPLCQSCYDRYYTNCTRCGALLELDRAYYLSDDADEEEPLCHGCYALRTDPGEIHSYYYKPDPIFYGEGARYFGVELEIDGAGERSDRAWQLVNAANSNGLEHIYIKHDGSLEDGMEIVTHPMTLGYHLAEMPWGAVVAEAVRMGYTSHKACTCGLHVHVNRSAFGLSEEAQEAVIARILFFVENHWNELLRFSRRTRDQMEQWAARYGWKDNPKAVLDSAKKEHYQRYKCVNLTNYDTIEFRMFRGTLKLNTLIATLQMVDRICEVALYLSDQEMQGLTWADFVSGCTAPELVQYLKERRLYINEPVAVPEEV